MFPTELRLTGPAGAPVAPRLALLPTPKRIVAAVALTLALLVGVVGLDMMTAQPALAVEEVEPAGDNTCGNLPIISAACRELLDGAAWLEDGVGDVGETVVAGAFDYFARWVATGAIGAIELVWVGIDGTTTPTVDSGGTVFATSIAAARALAFPLLVAAALYSLLKRDASIAVKSAFLYLPGSVVGMVVAGYIINGLLLATDQLSAAYLDDGQTSVAEWLDGVGGLIAAGVGIAAPILLVIFSFVVIGGAILVWLVMIVRSAAIIITYAFMPLAFAALIFPATRGWIKRLIEIQLSFILAKPVIVAVLALGSQTLSDVDNALVAMMQAAALFYLAAFSPFALMKLLPFVADEGQQLHEGEGREGGDGATLGRPQPGRCHRRRRDRRPETRRLPGGLSTGRPRRHQPIGRRGNPGRQRSQWWIRSRRWRRPTRRQRNHRRRRPIQPVVRRPVDGGARARPRHRR